MPLPCSPTSLKAIVSLVSDCYLGTCKLSHIYFAVTLLLTLFFTCPFCNVAAQPSVFGRLSLLCIR